MVAVHTKLKSGKLPEAWDKLNRHEDAPPDCQCGLCQQRRLSRCKDRFAIVAAGRQAGKSATSKRKIVASLALKKPWADPRYFYAAPTYQQVQDIAWEDFKRLIPPEWIPSRGINEGKLEIKTIFGSTLRLFGLDKPFRMEGFPGGWDGCVIDEMADQRPGMFARSILPQLTWRHGWCWRVGVPKRFGVGAAEFKKSFLRAKKGELPNTQAFTWSALDVIPKDTLEFAKSEMTAADYAEQFLALWQDAGGGVFYSFKEEVNVRPCNYNPAMPIYVGSDFNVDPMAWVLMHRYNDRLEVFDELFLRNTNTIATLNALWSRYSGHTSGWRFYGDATGRARRSSASMSDYLLIANDERFKKAGRSIHYDKSNPNVHDRFAACNVRLCNAKQENKLYIDPRCVHLIEDLTSRCYQPGTNDLPNDEGDIGHISDALGYPIYRLYPVQISGVAAPSVSINLTV